MPSSYDHDMPYPPPFYISDQGFNSDPPQSTDVIKPFDDISNGPMETEEEGFAVREWRRQNAIQLEQKEKIEKEFLNQIINEADEYKVGFYMNRQASLETNKAASREKEKLFLTSHEKFHWEADKHFWKAIAELIPNEAPVLEKKKAKAPVLEKKKANKDEDNKKPIIAVIQGPKPGKPTDLSRMRQIFLKLKHNTPAHLNTSPPELNSTNVCKT